MSEIPARDRIEAVRVAGDAEDLARGLTKANPLRWLLLSMAKLCRYCASDLDEDDDGWY